MLINKVGTSSATQSTSNINSIQTTKMKNINFTAKKDTVVLSEKTQGTKTVEEKQKILKKAQRKAAGYAFWGGLFSTAYYALRSDAKIARKYDLDPQKDKQFISQIKDKQTLYTIPSALLTSLGGAIAYFYAIGKNPKNLNVN